MFVAGSAVFGADDPAAMVDRLRGQAEGPTGSVRGRRDRRHPGRSG